MHPNPINRAGTRSPFYMTAQCRQCGTQIERRTWVKNPICVSCKAKNDRDRKRKSSAHTK